MKLQKEAQKKQNDKSHVKFGFIALVFFFLMYLYMSSFKRCHFTDYFYSHKFIHHVILLILLIKKEIPNKIDNLFNVNPNVILNNLLVRSFAIKINDLY
jgi:hypothetical protein